MDGQANRLRLLAFNNGPPGLKRLLVRQLGGRNSATTDALLPLAIQDQDLNVRLAALEVIGLHRLQKDLAFLSMALLDPHAAVRAAATRLLGQYESLQAGRLVQQALRDPSPHVRATAAWALGQVPSTQFSPALEAALADNDGQVRASAIKALGKVGRVEARLALKKMAATDPLSHNRQMASEAIEAICQRTASREEKRHQAALCAIDRLVDVRRSQEERQYAKESLVRIGAESLIPALDQALQASKDDRVRVDIVEIMASLPPSNKGQTTLLGYFHQVSPSVRRRAIVAMGDVGDEKAIYYLNEVAREGDQPGQLLTLEDAQLAREAVQRIRERSA